jgi:MFS family permease
MRISRALALARDQRLLFATRTARLFAYGLLSVVLALYLAELGMSEADIGALLTLTLLGDAAVSLWMTTRADRLGRRRILVGGAILMVFAAALFASTRSFGLLALAATLGIISPSGNEVGPFIAVEQAALAQELAPERRTSVFAWYNLVGSFATALGALAGGALVQVLRHEGVSAIGSYRVVVLGYGAIGLALILLFTRLSPAIEAPSSGEATSQLLGLGRSRHVVLRLAGLFALDSFAGGLIVQSLVAYWFHLRFGVEPALLGSIFFGANLLAGISALSAARVAKRIGLLNTMVLTHLPSNVLLILVPLMPTLPLAIAALLARFSISQMDVPTRQSYLMAVVSAAERSAASGVTGIARTLGAALAPLLSAPLLASPALLGVPFYLAGGLKIVYDAVLYRSFRAVRSADGSAPS